jgi:hypothetical protein
VVCGLWFVVCGLWFVVCGLWFVVCGLWRVAWGFRLSLDYMYKCVSYGSFAATVGFERHFRRNPLQEGLPIRHWETQLIPNELLSAQSRWPKLQVKALNRKIDTLDRPSQPEQTPLATLPPLPRLLRLRARSPPPSTRPVA